MAETTSKPAKTIAVELLEPHTHEGIVRQPGEKIELFEDQAAWLIDLKVAKAV